MPVFSLTTNVEEAKVDAAVITALTAALAKALNKPESYVSVQVRGGVKVAFAGDFQTPAGQATLKSIGGVGGESNKKLAKVLFPIIEKHLGIPGNRLFIDFFELGPSDIAYNGNTFA